MVGPTFPAPGMGRQADDAVQSLKTETLVIGAGPAGASAAAILARSGVAVVLVDQHDFPREKVCGDVLMAHALRLLDRLELSSEIARKAFPACGLTVYAPDGSHSTLRGEFAVMPRRELDAALCAKAVSLGASFLAPYRLKGAVEHEGRVGGAEFTHRGNGASLIVRAQQTVLATGASAAPLRLFGVCEREAPSAIAARRYYRLRVGLAEEIRDLAVCYDETLLPGYGWIFPGPDRTCNIGVGLFHDSRVSAPTRNLKKAWTRFVERFQPARRIVSGSEPLTPLRGAALRTGLTGARLHRPGLLVIGEAAGLTYSATGEGVGNALESGLLAGELIAQHRERLCEDATLGEAYETTLRRRTWRMFDGYRRAQRWVTNRSLCNLLSRRVVRGTYARAGLEAMIEEGVDPRTIFSVGGIVRALLF
jgi:geranylgeranyl reductase family protein